MDRLYLPDTSRPPFRQQSGMIFCQEEQLLNLLFAFTLAQRNLLQIYLFFSFALASVLRDFSPALCWEFGGGGERSKIH